VNIHLIGIGGVGMAGLAVLLKNRGHFVSGCDVHLGVRTQWLESLGIRVAKGHDPNHVDNAETVVVTPAVRADNPELLASRNVRYRGEVLAELVSEAKDSIAVCGSHGKTTTSTWIAKLLIALGENVEWAIGGATGDFPVGGTSPANPQPSTFNLQPRSPVLVVEADESDGTLAKYHAKTLVVTNCEYDHPDHFKTHEDYIACYETAKGNADAVIESEYLPALSPQPAILNPLAPHNRKNARTAIEVALRRGHRLDTILAAMAGVVKKLPDRRFQTIWPTSADPQPSTLNPQPSVSVVTDYAHHPTEMACAVQMARTVCKGKLRVLFQPHRYSRTKALLADFPKAFAGADEVVLCPTYAAFESPTEGGDIADLYRECRNRSEELGMKDVPDFFLARSCDEAWEHAHNVMLEGDVTLLLGAGDIANLVPKIQADLSRTTDREPRITKLWIGAGSNTWKSDLKLDVEYVKTAGPANALGASLGIPWMAGIPGTIGGWVKMNAGAFGHSISEVLEAVKVDGEWIAAVDCGFGYRTSNISGEIQDVRLKSQVSCPSQLSQADYLARRKKFPAGTKGSVFKNPSGDYAGRLLEAAGCKGLRVGGAHVWEGHANVIVAGPDANNSDFLALARLMYNRVFFRFGVRLEPEVQGIVI